MAKKRQKLTPQAKSKLSKAVARSVASRRKVTPKPPPAHRPGKPVHPSPKASGRGANVKLARRGARIVVKPAGKLLKTAADRPKTGKKPQAAARRPINRPPENARRPPAAAGKLLKTARRLVTQQPPAPVRRSTYAEAVALYQRGIEALQMRRFRDAAELLHSVVARFPEEKELHERAFLYLRVCERQIAAKPSKAETPEERVFAATVAINNGAFDQAIAILGGLIAEDPENDHATYMLGVANALKGRPEVALQCLSRSMALNPENRDVARRDPDLEPLRRTDDLRLLIASPPTPLPRKGKRVLSRNRGR